MYYVLREHLGLGGLTKDEVFILFYKLDRDGDGYVTYSDMGRAFVPKAQQEYAVLLESRGAYHSDHTQPRDYFSFETRELLRRAVRGVIDCEVSIELIKQRLVNFAKGQSLTESAYKAVEGYSTSRKKLPASRRAAGLSIDDLRDFLKHASGGNVYPVEKELQLLFDRMDRDQDHLISVADFAAAINPFMG
jgi:Ca2+-binding EF-hand superfamily protein